METVDEIHYYRSQGVKTVEMEASLLFTMSKVFNIITGAVFVISDILDPQKGHQLGFIQTTEYLFRVIEGFVGEIKVETMLTLYRVCSTVVYCRCCRGRCPMGQSTTRVLSIRIIKNT